jgi:hypothetical protein
MNILLKVKLCLASLLILGIFVEIGISATPPKPVFTQESSSAKVGRLLERSGYKYEKKGAEVWTIAFTAKTLASFNVILATQDDLLVTFVIISHKKDIELTPAFMQKLLKFNHNLDRVKVGIDDDGDLFVRTDQAIRVVDDKEFKDNVEQVAAAANEVYAGIKP